MDRFNKLSDLREIKTEQGHTLLYDLIVLFLAQTPKRLDQIRNAIACENYSLITRIAYIIRTNCSYLGAHKIAVLCENLEAVATINDPNKILEVKEYFYAIERSFAEFEKELQIYVAELNKENEDKDGNSGF